MLIHCVDRVAHAAGGARVNEQQLIAQQQAIQAVLKDVGSDSCCWNCI